MTEARKAKYIVSGFVTPLGGVPQEFRRDVIAKSEKQAVSLFANRIKTTVFNLSYEAKVTVTKPHVKLLYYIN